AVTFASAVLGTSFTTGELVAKLVQITGADGTMSLDSVISGLKADADADQETKDAVKAVQAAWSKANKQPVALVEMLLGDEHPGTELALLLATPTVEARLQTLEAAGDVGATRLAVSWAEASSDPNAPLDRKINDLVASLNRNDLQIAAKTSVLAV